jgi:antitoxin component of MazEF toxin-antitoxin module
MKLEHHYLHTKKFLLSPLPPKLCQSVPLVGGETVKVRMEKKQLEFEKARKELQEAQAQLQAIQVGRIQRRKLQKYV